MEADHCGPTIVSTSSYHLAMVTQRFYSRLKVCLEVLFGWTWSRCLGKHVSFGSTILFMNKNKKIEIRIFLIELFDFW
jgi:hypothetical protein